MTTLPAAAQVLIDPRTNRVLPDIYAKMGVVRGFQPPSPEKVVIILVAFSGGGKTTFVSSIPDALVVCFDPDGANSVVGPKAHRIYVKDHAGWSALRDQLVRDGASGKSPFKMVCIDTTDEWFWVLVDGVITEYNKKYRSASGPNARPPITDIEEIGTKGKGYAEVSRAMYEDVMALRQAGYGIVFTCHLQEKTITGMDGRDVTVTRPVLTNSCYRVLARMAYLKGWLTTLVPTTIEREILMPDGNKKKIVTAVAAGEAKPEYRLTVATNIANDEIKIRLPDLPPYIVVPRHGGWDAFKEAFAKAVATAAAEDKAINP